MVTSEALYDSIVSMNVTIVMQSLLIDGDQWKAEKNQTDQ